MQINLLKSHAYLHYIVCVSGQSKKLSLKKLPVFFEQRYDWLHYSVHNFMVEMG